MKLKNLFYFLWAIHFSILSIGCLPSNGVDSMGCGSNTAAAWLPETTIAASSTQAVTDPTVTAAPTMHPTATPMVTKQPTKSIEVTPTPKPATATLIPTVPTPTPQPLRGSLLIEDIRQGILRLDLEHGAGYETILPFQDNWLQRGIALSPSGKFAVYWFQTETASELWLLTVETQQSQHLLDLPPIEIDFLVMEWFVDDRYFYIDLQKKGQIGILELVESYLFDMETLEIISGKWTLKQCNTLATSPKTQQPAIWCSFRDNSEEHIVIEPNEETWITTADLAENALTSWADGWDWSANGDAVIYPEYGAGLHLFWLANNITKVISDGVTSAYGHLSLSPNGTYVAYGGACPVGCSRVMHIPTETTIWTSDEVSDFMTHPFAWSPDEQFFVTGVLGEGILFVETNSQHSLMWPDETLAPAEMIWLFD